MNFEFATAGRIRFGSGAINELGNIARGFGRRVMLVHGRNARRAQVPLDLLADEHLLTCSFSLAGEPKIENVEQGAALAREFGADMVVGFGGGSAIDAAKAVAGMAGNDGDLLDYLEVIGAAQPLPKPGLPFIAIPTTAGTGAEVTRNAVLGSPEHRVKVSFRSPYLLPKVAIVDPTLTVDLPPEITASTGMDALTQLIEPYVCSRANPFTDALCTEGLRRSSRSLLQAYRNGSDLPAREDLAVASLFSGLALANAGLGAVHGFAGPLGGMFPDAPHGALCAALLPHVMDANFNALTARMPGSEQLSRFRMVAELLTGNASASISDGIKWVRDLAASLRIQPLRTFGMSSADIPGAVDAALRASSMKANPVALTREELGQILAAAL